MSQSINSESTLDINDRDFLNSILYYSDGQLFWKKNGKLAGYVGDSGYIRIEKKKKRIFVHRAVYTMFHGTIPSGYQVHHKDGNHKNNRIENLEAVSTLRHGSMKSSKVVFNERTKLWECRKSYNYKKYLFTSTSKSGVSKIINNFSNRTANEADITYYNKYAVNKVRNRKSRWTKNFECTQEYIKKHMYYSDGKLYDKSNGREYGRIDKHNYVVTKLGGKGYSIHRLIYIYHYGVIPDRYVIDHIDQNKQNNDISNLRAVPPSINAINRPRKDSSNIYFINKRYKVLISLNGKNFYKTFSSDQKQEAIDFRNKVLDAREDFDMLMKLYGYSY